MGYCWDIDGRLTKYLDNWVLIDLTIFQATGLTLNI
jgi:hypothetical protein